MDKEIKKKMNTTWLNEVFVSLCDEMYCLHVFFSVSSWLQKFTKMHPVGFEPTHLSIAELKSAPLDHSGTNALQLSEMESGVIIAYQGY